MNSYWVPYKGRRPASVDINGHKLIIMSSDRSTIEQSLGLMGADRLRTVRVGESRVEQERALGKIAQEVDGGVVIAPSDVDLREVIRNLEDELPWLH